MSGRIDSNTAHITSIGSVSSNWDNVYTNLVTNSAAYLTSVDISLLISTSANWDSTYSTVNTNSATTWNYQGTDLKALSAGWSSTQTTVNTNSATWQLQTKSFIITNPTASAEYIIFRAPYNLTITRIDGFQTGGTGIDGMLTECDNNGLNPNKVNSTDMTLLTSNVSLTAFDNPSIDSGDYIGWMNGSISGDVSKFIVSVEYTRS